MSPPITALRRVAVGSANPVKVEAVRAVMRRIVPDAEIISAAVASGVPDQPWGDAETILGARARAVAACAARSADLGIGIEGGVVANADGTLRTCAWAVVVDATGREGLGGSLAMPLPESAAALVRAGMELGVAMDAVSGRVDVKRTMGAVGILTAGLVDRQNAYEVILAYALAPFISRALYGD